MFGAHADVLFVDTDPEWRRRGIGGTMTTAALQPAQRRGATQAGLDSSDAGLSLYRRLGFEPIGPATHFFRAATA